jgi:hypothetical protein
MFPSAVSAIPAPGVEGGFASANLRQSVTAGPGGLVAGSTSAAIPGVLVGRFAWAAAPNDRDGTPATVTNAGTGPVTGFVHNEQQGLITPYLGESAMLVPPGREITLMKSGEFWVINRGTAAATVGQKAFASTTDGSVSFAAAGATVAGYVETKWIAQDAGPVGALMKIASTPNG